METYPELLSGVQKELSCGNDYKNLPEMREDVYPSGERAILAGLLPGMQSKGSGAEDHKKMQGLRKGLFIPLDRQTLAELLQRMSGEAKEKMTAVHILPCTHEG